MDEPCRVQVVEGLAHLVEDVFAVPFSQDVLLDDGVQVDVHVLENEVDVAVVFRPDHFFQLNDVRVAYLHQEHYLSVGPLGISRIVKSVKILFEGLHFATLLVNDLPDVPVSSTADLAVHFETSYDVCLDLLAHNIIYHTPLQRQSHLLMQRHSPEPLN